MTGIHEESSTVTIAGRKSEILVFAAAGLRFGLYSPIVKELARSVLITPLSGAPAVVEGIVNVRGAVVPVFDLRARFRFPPKPVELSDRLVIFRAGERTAAFRADSVEGLAELEPGKVEDAKKVTTSSGYVAGIAKLADGLVLIHDPETFLATAESEALDAALSADGRGKSK